MNDDFEDKLRLTLRHRAAHVDDTTDLSRAAIDRSRVIRRNRNRLAVAATVAAVAIIAPLGLVAGDRLSGTDAPVAPPSSISSTPSATPTPTPGRPSGAPTSTGPTTPTSPPSSAASAKTSASAEQPTPTKVTLDLAGLPRGEAPRTVYLEGRTVITPAGRVRVPGAGLIGEAVYGDGRVFVTTHSGMLEIPIGGGPTREVPDVSMMRSSADSKAIAYAVIEYDADGVTALGGSLHHRSGGSRSQLELPAALEITIYAVNGADVYFAVRNADGHGVLQRWTAGTRTVTDVDAVAYPSFVSADGKLAGVPIALSSSNPRSVLVRVPDGYIRWHAPGYALRGLAGDAVLVEPAKSGRFGSELFGVLDSATGTLRHEWRGLVLDTAVESADSVLAAVEQDGKHALVRCRTATGRCELATPLAEGGSGGPGQLRYRLGS